MKNNHLTSTVINFSAVLLLMALLAMPFYFAKNFSQVAGVKSERPYLVVSQIDKFPNLKMVQFGNQYEITFTKSSQSQLFLGVLILNNPTQSTKIYKIVNIKGDARVFFGENQDSMSPQTTAPSSVSVPISILSTNLPQTQTIEFKIESQ